MLFFVLWWCHFNSFKFLGFLKLPSEKDTEIIIHASFRDKKQQQKTNSEAIHFFLGKKG